MNSYLKGINCVGISAVSSLKYAHGQHFLCFGLFYSLYFPVAVTVSIAFLETWFVWMILLLKWGIGEEIQKEAASFLYSFDNVGSFDTLRHLAAERLFSTHFSKFKYIWQNKYLRFSFRGVSQIIEIVSFLVVKVKYISESTNKQDYNKNTIADTS